MDAEHKKIIREEINQSTIPEELKVLTIMANATRILSEQCLQRLRAIYVKNGFKLKENSLLSGINDYCRMEMQACFQFTHSVEPLIQHSTFEVGGVENYDSFNADSNEIVRLVLLYIDRTANDKEAFAKVFKTLRNLPTKGIFEDKDISRFKMK